MRFLRTATGVMLTLLLAPHIGLAQHADQPAQYSAIIQQAATEAAKDPAGAIGIFAGVFLANAIGLANQALRHECARAEAIDCALIPAPEYVMAAHDVEEYLLATARLLGAIGTSEQAPREEDLVTQNVQQVNSMLSQIQDFIDDEVAFVNELRSENEDNVRMVINNTGGLYWDQVDFVIALTAGNVDQGLEAGEAVKDLACNVLAQYLYSQDLGMQIADIPCGLQLNGPVTWDEATLTNILNQQVFLGYDAGAVEIWRPATLKQEFDLRVQLQQSGEPSSATLGVGSTSDALEGLVSYDLVNGTYVATLEFPEVPYVSVEQYYLRVDAGPWVSFNPYEIKIPDPASSLTASSTMSSGEPSCQTTVLNQAGSNKGEVLAKSPPPTANAWRDFSRGNAVFKLYWDDANCKNSNQPPATRFGGYAYDFRGPINPPKGGPFYNTVGVAYKGTTGPGPNNFGYGTMTVRPVFVYYKPSGGYVKVEKVDIVGLNKESCTSFPTEVTDALALVPTSYTWSVILSFATKTRCSTNWKELKPSNGKAGDLDWVGFQIKKDSSEFQYEMGARLTLNAVLKGTYKMTVNAGAELNSAARANGAPTGTDYDVLSFKHSPYAKVV